MQEHRSKRTRNPVNYPHDPKLEVKGSPSVGLRRPLLFAWLPIPIFFSLLAAMWVVDLPALVEPPLLRPILNFVFITAIAFWIAVLAARSFLQSASVSILLFGCGLLAFGSSRLIASSAFYFFEATNLGVTVYALGVFLAGAIHLLVGVLASSASDRLAGKPKLVLIGAYGGTLLIVAVYTAMTVGNLMPAFFVEAAGFTPIRPTVLVLAVIMFAVAAILILSVTYRRPWTFGRWYGLALALLALGIFGVSFAPEGSNVSDWIGRAAQYLGGIYLLMAALTALRDWRQWDPLAYSALRESKERFRALAEASFEGIVISRDGIIADVNEQFARMVGYETEELIGKPLAKLLPPEDSEQLQGSLLSGSEVSTEHPMICREGRQIVVESRSRVLPRQDQTMQFLVIQDITARRQQEQALRESETKLRELFENMSEGFAVGEPLYDEKGVAYDLRLTRVNKAFEQQTGISHEVVGRPLRTVFPHLEEIWIEANARVALTGQPARFSQFNRDTNRHFDVVSFSPAKGQFAALFNDVTEKKRAENILRESEEINRRNLAQLNAIVNRMTEGLTIFDPLGNLVEMNPAALAIYGFEKQSSGGKPIERLESLFELFDLEGKPLPPDEGPLARVLRGESFRAYMVRVHRRENGKSWIGSFGGAPIYDDQRKMLLALLTVRDVTEQIEAEKELHRSRDELEQRVQERTAELTQRAHQLARLASELTMAEDRERRRLAEFLHDNLQQLLVGTKYGLHRLSRRLPEAEWEQFAEVENLLDESISASRTLTMELSPPILQEAGLAAGLEWLAGWMKKTHALTVDLNVDRDITIDREDMRLLLFQAVRELLFNVAKHARTDRATVKVSCHGDQSLQVVVEDRGVGFDAEAMAKNQHRAEGFGLFSIRERVDLLGGRVEVESSPGKGARFSLIVPLQTDGANAGDQEAAPQGPIPMPEVAASLPPPPSKIRLLLVDDHALVRQGISRLLSTESDVEIVGEAADGAGAVDLARSLHPDIVLMDYAMPAMDGVEATRLIHAELPETRIIGLSMYEEADQAKAMLDAGSNAFLSKTGKADVLIEAIHRVSETPSSDQSHPPAHLSFDERI